MEKRIGIFYRINEPKQACKNPIPLK